MKAFTVFVLICIAIFLSPAANANAPCEKIQNIGWEIGTLNTCYMDTTVINSKDFLITSDRDETVEGFNAYGNKKIEYLPKNIGAKFPNLLLLSAPCSIKEVKKENFKELIKLRWLWLNQNQIEKIDDDSFEYIPAVKLISLAGNKIKKLNGRAFASLPELTEVRLRLSVELSGNECVDEDFKTAERIAEMARVVTEKCRFDEPSTTLNGLVESKACGVSKRATGTIVRGENFERGDFPWMVALYRRLKQRLSEYFCGGTVISDRHVLTAAHCLEDLVARDITVVLGAYNLDDSFEIERLAKSPSRIFVHDHWNPHTDQFDADIAMLLIHKKIVFSNFVQPICLWESNDPPTASVGTLPGWGQSQNISRDYETIPTKLQLPIHANEDCFLKFPHLAGISSKRTFCAGLADGRGPCRGDSGGGFYVSVENVFYLKGIVSAAWDVDIYGECLLKMYSIYTNVLKFKPWIDATMQSSSED